MELITFIQGDLTVVHVTDGHAPPAPTAQDEALEQRRALTDRSAMLLVLQCTILDQSELIPLELSPGDVGGMVIVQDERPVLDGDPARSPLDPWLLMGQEDAARLGPPVGVGARVRR